MAKTKVVAKRNGSKKVVTAKNKQPLRPMAPPKKSPPMPTGKGAPESIPDMDDMLGEMPMKKKMPMM